MENLIKAVLAVMDEVKNIEKNVDVWVWQMSYKWVSDKEVKQKIGESMRKSGLVMLPISVEPTTQIDRWEEDDTYNKQPPYPKKSKQLVFTEVKTKYMLMHSSWECIEIAWYGHGVDTQDKGAGKATTYALKNALLYTFLVPTGSIDDTDTTHSQDIDIPNTKNFQTERKYVNKQNRSAIIQLIDDTGFSCTSVGEFETWLSDNWYMKGQYGQPIVDEICRNVLKLT